MTDSSAHDADPATYSSVAGIVKRKVNLPLRVLAVSFGALGLAAIAAAPSYYYYSEYQKAQLLLKNPTKAAEVELENTIRAVGKLIVLPSQEKPTLATVADVEKLRDQPFFRTARNGDKVLIYTDAKKAFLYRPESNILVEVAPLNVSEPEVAGAATVATGEAQMTTSSPSAAFKILSPTPLRLTTPTPKPVRVAIYNGTAKTGLAGTIEQIIQSRIPNVVITEKGNARSALYSSSLVVDITGTQRSITEQIASAIGGSVRSLPAGEPLPDADILVIAGQK
ncbi:MAG: LytR C-terminal domain-containing protein [Patescibacteria group bacterium]|nr:LytR C-terminal domain-containing protein [Patescibacteria group bacterium]